MATKKRKCSFSKDWARTYTWVRPIEGDTERVFCSLCKSSFSISHGGEYDVRRHSTCESHKKREQQKETSKSMESFLIFKEDGQVDKITAAEVTSVYHSVQHAQSYRSYDCES